MKSLRRILTLAFLAVLLSTWVSAQQEAQLLMDSAHNAAINFKKTNTAKGVDGSFDVGADLAKGLTALKVDFKFLPDVQKDIGDGNGALYLNLGSAMEIVGNLDLALPQEMKANNPPKKLDALLESVFTESKAYTKGNLALVVPGKDKFPKINIDGKMDGTSKTFTGNLNYNVEVGDEVKQSPFKSVDINLSEKEALTTLKVTVAMDPKSPQAASLKGLAQNPDQVTQGIKQGLGQTGVQVEKVELGEFKDSPDVSATLTIQLKDWRTTVSSKLAEASANSGAYQKVDTEKMKAAVAKCLEAKFEDITIKVNIEAPAVKGVVTAKVDNLNAFLSGYYDIIGMMMDVQLKDKAEDADFQTKLALAYQSAAFEDARRILSVWAESGVTFKGDFKATAEMSGGDGKDAKGPGDVKVNGDLNVALENTKSYIEKASAAGLPVGKNSAAKFKLNLTEAGRIQGTLFAFSDGKVLDYYKTLLNATLKKAGAPEEQVKLLEAVAIKGGSVALTLNKDGVKGEGYGETSDLTPVFKAAMAAASSELSGDPLGFQVAGKTEQGKMTVDGHIYFAKLLEGKSKEDVQKVMGLPVKDGAKPEEVKLVAITKPDVKVPGGLAAVKDDGQKLLGGSAVASAVGSLTGGGGGNGKLIFAGLIGAAVVGAGIAAGRKK